MVSALFVLLLNPHSIKERPHFVEQGMWFDKDHALEPLCCSVIIVNKEVMRKKDLHAPA